MNPYTLDIGFTNAQIETLYATGTNVILAKTLLIGSKPNVAWQVFQPLPKNFITWIEQYGIYATAVSIQNGNTLNQMSTISSPAALASTYKLQNSGIITGPVIGGQDNSFILTNLFNNTQGFMTVGLYQAATVNASFITNNSVSATETLLNTNCIMPLYTTVCIWLQAQLKSNTIVTNITSPVTLLTFGKDIDNISLEYNSASGYFDIVQSFGPTNNIKYKISHIPPVL